MSLSFWEQHVFILRALVIFFPPEIRMFLFCREIDPKVFMDWKPSTKFHFLIISKFSWINILKLF